MIMHGVLVDHKRPIDAHALGNLSTASSLLLGLQAPGKNYSNCCYGFVCRCIHRWVGGNQSKLGGSKHLWSLVLSLVSQAVLLSIEV